MKRCAADWESLAELGRENVVLMRNPDFVRMLKESRRQAKETVGIPLEEIRREFGLTRGERRSEQA